MPGPTDEQHDWVLRTLGVDPRATGWGDGLARAAATAADFAKGVGEGAADGVGGMARGVVHVGQVAGEAVYDLATDPAARRRAGGAIAGTAQATAAFAQTAATDPRKAASQTADAVAQGARSIRDTVVDTAHAAVTGYKAAAAQGHGAEFIGKGVGQAGVLVAGALIPGVGEAEGAAVGAEGAGLAAEASEASELAGTTETLAAARPAETPPPRAQPLAKPLAPPPKPLDPVKLETAKQALAPLMEEAKAGKALIDKAADETAAKFGGVVRKAPVKSLDRAAEKVLADYGGDARRIKDLARNTVIVPPDKTQAVIDDLVTKMKVPANNIKIQSADTDPLGYSGAIVNVRQPNGMLAEIQVNSPEMIYAKDAEAMAEKTLGPQMFSAIKQATGLPGGRGHQLYEEWRALPPGAPERAALEAESKAYYAAIRKRASGIDWKSVLK